MEIEWTAQNSLNLIEGCRDQLAKFEKSIDVIIENQLWINAGFESFESMFVEMGFDKFKLSAAIRRNAIEIMKMENPEMSNRQTAKTLGTSESTVRRDLNMDKMGASNDALNDLDRDFKSITEQFSEPNDDLVEESNLNADKMGASNDALNDLAEETKLVEPKTPSNRKSKAKVNPVIEGKRVHDCEHCKHFATAQENLETS